MTLQDVRLRFCLRMTYSSESVIYILVESQLRLFHKYVFHFISVKLIGIVSDALSCVYQNLPEGLNLQHYEIIAKCV